MSHNAAGALEGALSKAPFQAGAGCPSHPVPALQHPAAQALDCHRRHRAEVDDQAEFRPLVHCRQKFGAKLGPEQRCSTSTGTFWDLGNALQHLPCLKLEGGKACSCLEDHLHIPVCMAQLDQQGTICSSALQGYLVQSTSAGSVITSNICLYRPKIVTHQLLCRKVSGPIMPSQSFTLPVISWTSPGWILGSGGASADVTTVIVLSTPFADSNASMAPEGHRQHLMGKPSCQTCELCPSCLCLLHLLRSSEPCCL